MSTSEAGPTHWFSCGLLILSTKNRRRFLAGVVPNLRANSMPSPRHFAAESLYRLTSRSASFPFARIRSPLYCVGMRTAGKTCIYSSSQLNNPDRAARGAQPQNKSWRIQLSRRRPFDSDSGHYVVIVDFFNLPFPSNDTETSPIQNLSSMVFNAPMGLRFDGEINARPLLVSCGT